MPNALGLLDLRSNLQSGAPGPVPQGFGIFVYPFAVAIPGAIPLGTTLDTVLDAPVKAAIRAALALLDVPTATSLKDMLWEILTTLADPTGLLRVKPLMPTVMGNLELYLGGFSLIRSENFDTSHPHWPQVLAVLREDYRRIREERKTFPQHNDTHKRVLASLAQQFRCDYHLFIPPDLPDEGVLPPHTTITDNFNRADSDTLGTSSEGWSWTEVAGDTDIVTNAAAAGGAGAGNRSRADSDLSTSNHYSQGDCSSVSGAASLGTSTRFAAAASTFYMGIHANDTTDTYRIFKDISGTLTKLSGVNTTAPGAGAILDKMSSDGSTQEFTSGGTVRNTITDTSITGNLRGGLWEGPSPHTIDNFEAADLIAALPPGLNSALWHIDQDIAFLMR